MAKAVNIARSHRLDGIGEYYFSRRLREIAEIEAATGRQIVKLAMGSPDLPPHQSVIDRLAKEAQRPDVHKYMSYKGEPILRKAFADWYKKWYRTELDYNSEVLPLIGSKEGIMHICMTFLNKGDKVLVPNPGYPTYSAAVRLAGGPLIVAILIGRFGTHFHLVTYTTMSANLMLREIGIALFLAAVGIGAGDGFIDAIVDGGYRWIGYGVAITVLPLIIVALIARLWLKMNYYTLMGLIAGSTTDPPALAYANATAGNDMPAVGYSTVYPVVMFLRVLTAQIFILFAL